MLTVAGLAGSICLEGRIYGTNRTIFSPASAGALSTCPNAKKHCLFPRFTSPFTIFWYWLLFFVLLGAIVGLWSLPLPVHEQAAGEFVI